MIIRDREGIEVRGGDTIHFCYGIPPIGVDAKIVDEGGELVALTPGHYPEKTALCELSEYMEFCVTRTVHK